MPFSIMQNIVSPEGMKAACMYVAYHGFIVIKNA